MDNTLNVTTNIFLIGEFLHHENKSIMEYFVPNVFFSKRSKNKRGNFSSWINITTCFIAPTSLLALCYCLEKTLNNFF
jgi:hypothetical protein